MSLRLLCPTATSKFRTTCSTWNACRVSVQPFKVELPGELSRTLFFASAPRFFHKCFKFRTVHNNTRNGADARRTWQRTELLFICMRMLTLRFPPFINKRLRRTDIEGCPSLSSRRLYGWTRGCWFPDPVLANQTNQWKSMQKVYGQWGRNTKKTCRSLVLQVSQQYKDSFQWKYS